MPQVSQTPLSAAAICLCLQAPQARSVFQQGASQRPPSARFLRQWATFEKREGDLEVLGQLGSWASYARPPAGLPSELCCSSVCASLPAPPAPVAAHPAPARPLPLLPCPQRSAALYAWAAKADPRDDRTWLQWGLLERRRGRAEAALYCFSQGIKVSPRNPYLWQVYGVLLFQQGRALEAREVLRQGVSHNPGNPQLCMEWALAEQQAGKEEDALLIFEQGATSPEPHAPLFAAWLSLAQRMGRTELAASIQARLHEQQVPPA